MYENSLVHGIHKSRYVASFWLLGGYRGYFRPWLEQLEIEGSRLTEEEVDSICDYAFNGKLELQKDADKFFNKLLKKD